MDVAETLRSALQDRYVIERELGQGGMATVYLAEDLKHHRKVALKVLRPEIAVTVGADRFAREIDVAARLQHPNRTWRGSHCVTGWRVGASCRSPTPCGS